MYNRESAHTKRYTSARVGRLKYVPDERQNGRLLAIVEVITPARNHMTNVHIGAALFTFLKHASAGIGGARVGGCEQSMGFLY